VRLFAKIKQLYSIDWGISVLFEAPTIAQIAEVHDFIRAALVERFGGEGDTIRILYGGSMKPENAADLMAQADVDGGLVGGASLKADDFAGIVAAAEP